MLTVFQVCFFVGIGLTLLFFIFGNLFEAVGIDGLDLDFDLFGFDLFLPINPILYILFSTVFGGIGWILIDLHQGMTTFVIVIIAIFSGVLVSSLINFLVIKPLKRAQNTSTPNADELVGVRASVTETIVPGGFGEISFVVNGNSFTSPAKATNGGEIRSGEDVAICWIEEHVFYVVSIENIKTTDFKQSTFDNDKNL